MQAVVCHGPKDYRLETVDMPAIGPNELLISIAACGICASDCKCHSGAKMFWGGDGQPSWVKAPVIPGHEFFGYVEALGEGAGEHFGVEKGDRVIAEQIVPCGKCRFCASGKYWMCEVHNIFGFQRIVADGGMADYMRLPPTSRVHKIPDGISLEDAAIIEPLSCAIHTVNRGDIQLDDVVVIAGAGPLGLMMVQVAALRRVQRVRLGNERRLVDHRRPQGARRARCAPGALLLPRCHRPAGARLGHLAGHRHARLSADRMGARLRAGKLAGFHQGAAHAAAPILRDNTP
jgi:L-iditol 2-dehydrogenase